MRQNKGERAPLPPLNNVRKLESPPPQPVLRPTWPHGPVPPRRRASPRRPRASRQGALLAPFVRRRRAFPGAARAGRLGRASHSGARVWPPEFPREAGGLCGVCVGECASPVRRTSGAGPCCFADHSLVFPDAGAGIPPRLRNSRKPPRSGANPGPVQTQLCLRS